MGTIGRGPPDLDPAGAPPSPARPRKMGVEVPMADPSNQPQPVPARARILRYALWASEIALALAVIYAVARRPPQPAAPAATPPAQASPATR